MATKIFKGLRFTQDTNCAIDWQTGFDMPGCPGHPYKGLLNASGTPDDRIVAAKIKERFPAPTSCNGITQALAELNDGLSYSASVEKSGGLLDKIKAITAKSVYKSKLADYTDFYNKNCIGVPSVSSGSGSGSSDPVLQTATPSGSSAGTSPTTGGGSTTAVNTGSGSASASAGSTNTGSAGSPITKTSIPKWVYWGLGGLAVLTIGVMAFKGKKAA